MKKNKLKKENYAEKSLKDALAELKKFYKEFYLKTKKENK